MRLSFPPCWSSVVADALAEINRYKSVYYAPEVVEACTRVVESPGAGWMNSGA